MGFFHHQVIQNSRLYIIFKARPDAIEKLDDVCSCVGVPNGCGLELTHCVPLSELGKRSEASVSDLGKGKEASMSALSYMEDQPVCHGRG